jgi:TonB family protein
MNKLNYKTNIMKLKYILLLPTLLIGEILFAEPDTPGIITPQAIEVVEPEVPIMYARAKVQGEVMVRFKLNEQGEPENIQLESASNKVYGRVVEEAVKQWRFEPPMDTRAQYRLPVLINSGTKSF